MVPIPNVVEMRRFFAGLTEFTFETHLGVADPTLIDYISELLTRFTHHDEIFRIRDQACNSSIKSTKQASGSPRNSSSQSQPACDDPRHSPNGASPSNRKCGRIFLAGCLSSLPSPHRDMMK